MLNYLFQIFDFYKLEDKDNNMIYTKAM